MEEKWGREGGRKEGRKDGSMVGRKEIEGERERGREILDRSFHEHTAMKVKESV